MKPSAPESPAKEQPGEQTDIAALYDELLFAVGNKYPGETRHQTALRYIRRAEEPSNDTAQAAMPPPPERP